MGASTVSPRARTVGTMAVPQQVPDLGQSVDMGGALPASMGDQDISDEAIFRATGRHRGAWHDIIESSGGEHHAQRAERLGEQHTELSGWWVQMLVVDYERAKGLREVGETSRGFQVSTSKTLYGDPYTLFERIVATPFLPGACWEEGAAWKVEGARVEVRRVRPGKLLRWIWDDGHASTVVLDLWPRSGERTQVRFTHSNLEGQMAREAFRERWRVALDKISAAVERP